MTQQQNKSSLRFSSLTSHYWDEDGAWKKEFDELTKEMPVTGSAETLNGELVRAINRLYWDYCNNGNGNAAEVTTTSGWDDDEEEEEIGWNDYYKKFFDIIVKTADDVENELTQSEAKEIATALETINHMVTNYGYISDEFGDNNMHAYDVLTDFVCWYCLNHTDKPLPTWYGIG